MKVFVVILLVLSVQVFGMEMQPGSIFNLKRVSKRCSEGQYSCKNGRCIDVSLVCDTEDDCDDREDEWGCDTFSCTGVNMFKCANGRCISRANVCDGDNDCSDGSDEMDCASTGRK